MSSGARAHRWRPCPRNDSPPRAGYPTRLLDLHPHQRRLVRHHRPEALRASGRAALCDGRTAPPEGIRMVLRGDGRALPCAQAPWDFESSSQLDELADGDDPPTAAGSPMPLFFSVPEDAGLRYEFFPAIPFPLDPRIAPGWTVPPVTDDDPLGIERCSHHTVLTGRPERALRLVVDVLGGDIVHEGRDEIRGTTSTYVTWPVPFSSTPCPTPALGPTPTGPRTIPNDTYHAITWKVADLERAERHLEAQGVRIQVALRRHPRHRSRPPVWVFPGASPPADSRRSTA